MRKQVYDHFPLGAVFFISTDNSFTSSYCLIALDVFRQIPYAVSRNEQTAWLSLLVTETVEEAEELMTEYPWLEEIYKEIAMLRQRPEEVLHMFSEALRIMDRNTVKYMVEEQQKELEEKQRKINDQQEQLGEKQRQIDDQQKQLGEKQRQIDDQQEQLTDQQRQLFEKDQEIRRLREQLAKEQADR